MSNKEIKNLMKREKIFMWQVAKKLNLHESVFCKWFREPLSKTQETQVLSAIEAIKLSRIKEQQTK